MQILPCNQDVTNVLCSIGVDKLTYWLPIKGDVIIKYCKIFLCVYIAIKFCKNELKFKFWNEHVSFFHNLKDWYSTQFIWVKLFAILQCYWKKRVERLLQKNWYIIDYIDY